MEQILSIERNDSVLRRYIDSRRIANHSGVLFSRTSERNVVLAVALAIIVACFGFSQRPTKRRREPSRGRPALRVPGESPGHRRSCAALELEARGRSARGEEPGASAYQIIVAPTEALLREDKGTLWDTRKVATDQSLHVPYAGKPLVSHDDCWWKVRVWDQDGNVSDMERARAVEHGHARCQGLVGPVDRLGWRRRDRRPVRLVTGRLVDLVPGGKATVGHRSAPVSFAGR